MDADATGPVMNVLDAIAETTGIETHEIEPPLYGAIDPDALERLLASGGDIAVTFEYADHTVTVASDGSVGFGEETRSVGG